MYFFESEHNIVTGVQVSLLYHSPAQQLLHYKDSSLACFWQATQECPEPISLNSVIGSSWKNGSLRTRHLFYFTTGKIHYIIVSLT